MLAEKISHSSSSCLTNVKTANAVDYTCRGAWVDVDSVLNGKTSVTSCTREHLKVPSCSSDLRELSTKKVAGILVTSGGLVNILPVSVLSWSRLIETSISKNSEICPVYLRAG